MFTAENLKTVNDQIKAIPVRGKNYAQVTERVKAFRSMCPDGKIISEIVNLDTGSDGLQVVTMKTIICDETGKEIASGFAQEKEGSSNINKTSFIENCETSAIGRALGFAGIGIECSMASAEEVVNAIMNQEKISKKEQKILENLCAKKGKKVSEMFNIDLETITAEQYVKASKVLSAMPDAE